MDYITLTENYNQNHDTFISFKEVFTKKECEKIIEIGESCNIDTSKISDDVVDTKIRNSFNSWISIDNRPKLFNRLHDILQEANRFYQFDIDRFDKDVQFTKYCAGQYYNWHQDLGPGVSLQRKLSIVVNLQNEFMYEGGNLQFFSAIGKNVPREQGSVIVFPSYEPHRVTPVKEGVRYSLVVWVNGRPFR